MKKFALIFGLIFGLWSTPVAAFPALSIGEKWQDKDCVIAQEEYRRLWCEALLCQAERVVNACCLDGEDIHLSRQSSADQQLDFLWSAGYQTPEQLVHFLVSSDIADLGQSVRKSYPWLNEVCADDCLITEEQFIAMRMSLAGCHLRLEACGEEFDPTAFFPGYLFRECENQFPIEPPKPQACPTNKGVVRDLYEENEPIGFFRGIGASFM